MNTTSRILSTIVAAAAVSLAAVRPAEAGFSVGIAIAPPPPRVVVVPAPRAGYVWAPGFWRWTGHGHAWVEGRWLRVRPGRVWVEDRWEARGPNWVYLPGHWAHVR